MLKRKKLVKTQLFFYSEFRLFLFAPSQANDEDTELVLQDGVKYLGTHIEYSPFELTKNQK